MNFNRSWNYTLHIYIYIYIYTSVSLLIFVLLSSAVSAVWWKISYTVPIIRESILMSYFTRCLQILVKFRQRRKKWEVDSASKLRGQSGFAVSWKYCLRRSLHRLIWDFKDFLVKNSFSYTGFDTDTSQNLCKTYSTSDT